MRGVTFPTLGVMLENKTISHPNKNVNAGGNTGNTQQKTTKPSFKGCFLHLGRYEPLPNHHFVVQRNKLRVLFQVKPVRLCSRWGIHGWLTGWDYTAKGELRNTTSDLNWSDWVLGSCYRFFLRTNLCHSGWTSKSLKLFVFFSNTEDESHKWGIFGHQFGIILFCVSKSQYWVVYCASWYSWFLKWCWKEQVIQ